ncbi:MAG: hypothetical protein PHH77_03800 [Victivallaceae bacterium]|nr:hypothetical protein [Victivallaceae bacterium]
MEDVAARIEELEKDVRKIKVFCSFVAVEHDHVPQLKRIWSRPAGSLVYPLNTAADDVFAVKAALVKAIMKLEDRLSRLETKRKMKH